MSIDAIMKKMSRSRVAGLKAVLVITMMLFAAFGGLEIAQARSAHVQKQPTRWTDKTIEKEAQRYNFGNWKNTFVVLSEFIPAGGHWKDLDNPPQAIMRKANDRKKKILQVLQTDSSTRSLKLANFVRLIKTERRGDWSCIIQRGCYPKGFVLGVGPVTAVDAIKVCYSLRMKNAFCYVLRGR